jgi:quercetin dioxygenase-like cupin family protein
LGGRACSDGIFGRNEDGSYSQSTLFETDTIRLARVQLGPGGLLPEHHHDRCHVLVFLAQTALLDSASDAHSRELHLNAGDDAWYSERVVHALKNLSTQNVQLITVEFK